MSQQKLYKSIFDSAGEEDDEVKLRDIAAKYPYYAPAHYFLLKHTSKDSPDYNLIAGKTALHFNNPFYLNYLLHNDATEEVLPLKTDMVETDLSPEPVEVESSNETQEQTPIKKKITEDELVFEPLHTTDYFASQGIKLSDEVKPDDKLGKQLRSFTDWLKTMKKVHEQKLPAGNAALDVTVQNIADKSNQEEVIVTESMADVYKDQGKIAKAREIYQKLSLLDPAKSAYFAAKIDSLKEK